MLRVGETDEIGDRGIESGGEGGQRGGEGRGGEDEG